jgi:hypothetical protein
MSSVMLTYQDIGKLSPKKPLFTGVSVFFIVHTIMYYFLGDFWWFLEFSSYLCRAEELDTRKGRVWPSFVLSISLCGEPKEGFFLLYEFAVTGEPKNSLPSWLSLWRAGAIAFLAPGWGLGASHKSAPITLTWSDADGGVFHSITRYQHSVILTSLNRDIYCFIPWCK